MEFRRLACTAAAACPSSSLYFHAIRRFSSVSHRANNSGIKSPSASFQDLLHDLSKASSSTVRGRPNFRPSFRPIDAPPLDHLTNSTRIPKMGPTAGRSVVVQTDLAQAFMRLRSVLSQNKVKTDFFHQRFHERPGLKRKRLRSERHRRRFKEGFRRMISLVMDMKKKGM